MILVRLFIAALSILTCSNCASRPVNVSHITGSVMASPQGPDLSGVLRLMGLRGIAHACPISPNQALTNVHVVGEYYDTRPFMWSTSLGAEGLLGDIGTFGQSATWPDRYRDLARVAPHETTFPHFYPIAKQAPGIGEQVWFVGYDWRKKNDAFGTRVFKSKVLRVVSGHVIFAPAGQPGSSGSCVLNAAGEVVAINMAGMETEDRALVGIGVAVYGSLLDLGGTKD